jgi:hypothetical protein
MSDEIAIRRWLETSEAHTVLDDAVLGCLHLSDVIEICEDFGITRRQFSAALDDALAHGF